MSKARAIRKVQVAIDKMIDLQTMIDGDSVQDMITRILERLRELENHIESRKRLNP